MSTYISTQTQFVLSDLISLILANIYCSNITMPCIMTVYLYLLILNCLFFVSYFPHLFALNCFIILYMYVHINYRLKKAEPTTSLAETGLIIIIFSLTQYWPGSRAERPIPLLRSARGGGWGPPLSIGIQEVGTYIYSRTYTAHGALGRLL
jgi:hypothetical protein